MKEFEKVRYANRMTTVLVLTILQILTDFKEQGQEDQALEKRVEQKKAAAKRKATRRSKSSYIIEIWNCTLMLSLARK